MVSRLFLFHHPAAIFVIDKDDKVVHEHVYWDQASVLNQLGLLDAEQLPVVGAEAAQQLLEPKGPLNQLIERARKRAAESERT